MKTKYNPKDPLCYKVYNWEDAQWLAGVECFDWKLIGVWAKRAARYYKVYAPKMKKAPKGARTSGYGPEDQTIYLVKWHCNPVVLLHEVAHHICDLKFGPERMHHSHEWFSIYCWLLLKFNIYSRKALKASLKAYGLRLRPMRPEDVPE